MFTQKQLKGIVFCAIGLLALIFAIIEFADGITSYGYMDLIAALVLITVGLFDAVVIPTGTQFKRPPQNYAPQQNYATQQNFAPQQNYAPQQNFAPQQNYAPQQNNYNNPNQ